MESYTGGGIAGDGGGVSYTKFNWNLSTFSILCGRSQDEYSFLIVACSISDLPGDSSGPVVVLGRVLSQTQRAVCVLAHIYAQLSKKVERQPMAKIYIFFRIFSVIFVSKYL